jgi:hypothetical protein
MNDNEKALRDYQLAKLTDDELRAAMLAAETKKREFDDEFARRHIAREKEIRRRIEAHERFEPTELLFAAVARCRCGAGLAYPIGVGPHGAWECSRALLEGVVDGEHDALPFAFYSVREEGSIRASKGSTTRPPGTRHMTVGTATCPRCATSWKSKPYDASGENHHWFSGPCPSCCYAVGAGGSYSSKDGPPISTRYGHVITKGDA